MEICLTGIQYDDDFETFEEQYGDDDFDGAQARRQNSSKMLITGKFRNGESAFGILNSFRPWILVRFVSKDFMPDFLRNGVYSSDEQEGKARERSRDNKKEALDDSLFSDDVTKLKSILRDLKIYYSSVESNVERKNLYGWTSSGDDGGSDARRYKWFKIYFNREYLRRSAVKRLKQSYDFYVYEEDDYSSHNSGGDKRKKVKNTDAPFYAIVCDEPAIVKPETQYIVSKDIRLCGWIRIPKKSDFTSAQYTWKASYEFECHCDEIEPLNDIIDIPPLKIISYDIEVMSAEGKFPEACDPRNEVINIGSVVYNYGAGDVRSTAKNYAFHLKKIDAADRSLERQHNCVVDEFIGFETEQKLLTEWRRWLFSEMDVDILVGYNTSGFDLKYMVDRAKMLGCFNGNFDLWSKLRSKRCSLKEEKFSSEQKGTRTFSYWQGLFGTFDFDLYIYLMDKYKWRSYSLNSACQELLPKETLQNIGLKIDLAPRKLWDNYSNPDEELAARGRYENAVYCGKDCVLPLLLTIKCGAVIQFVEMSRLTFTSLEDIQNRGQIVKIINQLSYFCFGNGYAINLPYEEVKSQMKSIPGATVIEPKKGFYQNPVATLDFASLYPSIMIAHNLCFSTIVLDRRELRNPGNDINSFSKVYGEVKIYSPEEQRKLDIEKDNHFVQHRKGVLPQMLENLLAARNRVKGEMKVEKDDTIRDVLNVRQLVLKISANSIYGFTCALVNKLVCTYIGETVTATGRQMIERSRLYTLQNFRKRRLLTFDSDATDPETGLKGLTSTNLTPEEIQNFDQHYDNDNEKLETDVIYGDTDSIMIRFPFPCNEVGLRRAWDWGVVMADEITRALFKAPIKLTFEKIYWPYILYMKKKYFALKFEGSLANPVIDVKGLGSVRRDTFLFTSNLMKKLQTVICMERDIAKANEILRHEIERVFMAGLVPYEDFIISKKLKAIEEYSTPETEIHVNVAQKMKKRNPGSEPRSGDRVNYVVIYIEDTGVKICNKGEDPEYAREHKLKLDLVYYFSNKVVNEMVNFYYLFDPGIAERMKLWTDMIKKSMLGVRSVGAFMTFGTAAHQQQQQQQATSAATTTTATAEKATNSRKRKTSGCCLVVSNEYLQKKAAIEKTESTKRKARTHITKLGIKKFKKA